MSAQVFEQPQAVTAVGPPTRKIERVEPNEQCTLVTKQGSRMARLRFNEPITVDELRDYCNGQLGWEGLAELDIMVDGTRHAASTAATITLEPEARAVGFETPVETPRARTVEFTRRAPSKG